MFVGCGFVLTPSPSTPVAGKLGDKVTETKEEKEKIDDYHRNVAQTRVKGPKFKFPSPATENQVYGWYDKPLLPMDRKDRRFYMPKRESPQTKIAIVILMSNPKKKP